jgi:hypothetical protein
MFRVQISESPGAINLKVAGKFVSHFVEDATRFLSCHKGRARVTVDISEISFVDFCGERALNWMRVAGATFVAKTPYSLRVCRRLRLPVRSATLSPELAARAQAS